MIKRKRHSHKSIQDIAILVFLTLIGCGGSGSGSTTNGGGGGGTQPQPSVTITPTTATFTSGATAGAITGTFTATAVNVTNPVFIWTVTPSTAGSVTATTSGLTSIGIYAVPVVQTATPITITVAISGTAAAASASITVNPASTPAATPTASPNGGTFNAAQTVTLSDTTAGASISYTITPAGSTTAGPTTPYTAPFVVSASSTINMWATATNYSQSSSVSVPFTINNVNVITVDSTISIDLFANLPGSTFVHCSTTCDLSGLTGVITPGTSDTTMATGAIPVSYTPSSSGGNLFGGNSIYEDHTNTATIAWTRGSWHGTSTITVNVPAPTITAFSPSSIDSASTSDTFNTTGTNFERESATQTGSQNQGTQAIAVYGATCGTAPASNAIAGVAWNSATSITQYESGGGLTIGAWSYWVETDKAADGTGGGKACMAHAFDSVASGTTSGTNGHVVASVNPENGVLSIISGTIVTDTYNLASGAGTPVFADDDHTVYVPNPGAHAIAVINLQTHELSAIPTGDNLPGRIVKGSSNMLYFLATPASKDGKRYVGSVAPLSTLFRVDGQSVSQMQPAGNYTAVAVSGSTLVELSPSQESNSTLITQFDTRTATQKSFTISGYAQMVTALPDGTLLAFSGDTNVSVLDLNAQASSQVTFPAGILSFSGEYVALKNGSIWQVAITPDGTGKPQFSGNFLVSQPVDNLYAGFAKDSAGMLHFQSRTAQGSLIPAALHVTSEQ